MLSPTRPCPICSRRQILKAGALALLPLAIPSALYALADQAPMTANGGTDPYPIPWLDKNGSHNQPAGPNLEPSHIYHFKGRVARCSTFTGAGTDNQGNRMTATATEGYKVEVEGLLITFESQGIVGRVIDDP